MKNELGNNHSLDSSESVASRSPISRRTIVAGAVWATPAIMLATSSPAFAASTGGMSCELNGKFYSTQAGGQFLSGSLFNLNLANIAEVHGIKVNNTPVNGLPIVTFDPASSVAVPNGRPDGAIDAYKDPLSLTALNALNVNLGGLTQSLGSLLNLAEAGVVNQYGHTIENGFSRGFSGLVSNSGGVTLADSTGAPDVATIDLKTILSRLGGSSAAALVDALVGLTLKVGAVAGNAQLDACNTTTLREYYIAKLGLNVASNVAATAVSGVVDVLDTIESTVNGLTAKPNGLVTKLVDDIVGIVGGAIGILGLGTATSSTSVEIDLSAVRDLLTDTITGNSLKIDLDNPDSLISLDIAAMLGGLNGLNPNTELLLNSSVINAQVDNIGDELDAWMTSVTDLLDNLYKAVKIKVSVDVALTAKVPITGRVVNVASLNVLLETTIGDLLNGKSKFVLDLAVLPDAGLVGGLVSGILGGLTGVVGPLLNVLLAPLGTAIDVLVKPLLANVGTILATLVGALTTLVEDLLGGLFGQSGLVSLMANVQEGAYDVAALKLSVLPTTGGINVKLAQAYAGPNVQL